jgi:hypothetical protein
MHRFYRSPLFQVMTFLSATLGSFGAQADYVQTNLVSDISGFATITAPMLMNPWGMSFSTTSPFWISNQGVNTSTLYTVAGGTPSKVTGVNSQGFVGIPTTTAGPQGPTGQVNNINTASFQLTPGAPGTSARFLFANLNGTISAWAGGLTSSIQVTTPGRSTPVWPSTVRRPESTPRTARGPVESMSSTVPLRTSTSPPMLSPTPIFRRDLLHSMLRTLAAKFM